MPFGGLFGSKDKKEKASSKSSSSNKGDKDKKKLASLGIDPSLLDDPEDMGDDSMMNDNDFAEFEKAFASPAKKFNPNDVLKVTKNLESMFG
jgi:hypothetical protein